MATVGGVVETKEIGLNIGISGTHNNTEINNGKLKLKQISVDAQGNPVYADSGTWISDVIDLKDKFADFEKVFTTNTDNKNSSIAVLTRVSDNGVNWSNWVAVAYDGTILSNTKQYIQVRVDLFAGFETDNYLINMEEFISENSFLEMKTKKAGSYIIPKLTSNTSSTSGFAFSKGSYNSASYAEWKAFDNSTSTHYYSLQADRNNGLLGFYFNNKRRITKYRIQVYNSALSAPKDFFFEASNDTTTGLDGTWKILDKQTVTNWSTAMEFSFKNTEKYSAYRVRWTSNNNHSSYTTITELNFYEEDTTVIQTKRDYDFDMALDSTWTGEGSLHRKKITRDDWLRIDKTNVLKNNVSATPITWDTNKKTLASTAFSNNNMSVFLDNLGQTAITNEGRTSGKWYWEIKTGSILNAMVGVATTYTSTHSSNKGVFYKQNGSFNFITDSTYGTAYTNNITIGIALDLNVGTIEFYRNGVSQGIKTGILSLDGDIYYPAVTTNGGSSANNFTLMVTEDSFNYPVPNGFNAYQIEPIDKTLILHDGEYKTWEESFNQDIGSVLSTMTSDTTPAPYVASASSIYGTGYPAWKAFTKSNIDSNSCWIPATTTNEWIMIKLDKPKKMSKVKITSNFSVNPTSAPKNFIVQGSNDGISFTDLKEFDDVSSWVSNQTKEYNLDTVSDSYLYYRLFIKSNAGYTGYICIGDLDFIFESEKPAQFKTVSSTLPTSEQFLSDGMDSLSTLLDRKVKTLAPIDMTIKNGALQTGEKGKVFSKTIDLKKYMDLRKVKVEVMK